MDTWPLTAQQGERGVPCHKEVKEGAYIYIFKDKDISFQSVLYTAAISPSSYQRPMERSVHIPVSIYVVRIVSWPMWWQRVFIPARRLLFWTILSVRLWTVCNWGPRLSNYRLWCTDWSRTVQWSLVNRYRSPILDMKRTRSWYEKQLIKITSDFTSRCTMLSY